MDSPLEHMYRYTVKPYRYPYRSDLGTGGQCHPDRLVLVDYPRGPLQISLPALCDYLKSVAKFARRWGQAMAEFRALAAFVHPVPCLHELPRVFRVACLLT